MTEIKHIREELQALKNPEKAGITKKYLKSPYSFYGISVPELRKIAERYKNLDIYATFNIFDELWDSGNHEEMSLALFLLTNHKKNFNLEFWDFLMKPERLSKFKTWDHIDECCSHTLGVILAGNTQLNSEIKKLSESRNSWERRISIVSQYPSIKKGRIQLTILLAEKLCYDEDIYVQKATGWMLREASKKNLIQVKQFLDHHKDMKPICLSYATEKMPEYKKQLKEKIKQEKDFGKRLVFSEKDESLDKIKYFQN